MGGLDHETAAPFLGVIATVFFVIGGDQFIAKWLNNLLSKYRTNK